MSTYVTRYIEVRRKDIDGCLRSLTEEVAQGLEVGKVYSTWENYEQKYYKVIEGENSTKKLKSVDKDDVNYKWELVQFQTKAPHSFKYLDDEDNESTRNHCHFYDCGGPIRDKYLSPWDNDYNITNRGYPCDMSDELKKILEKSDEYHYNKTYVGLNEWETIASQELAKFKESLTQAIDNKNFKEINDKLDLLFLKVKDPFYEPETKKKKKSSEEDSEDEYFDEVKYLFEEDFWDYISIIREVTYAYRLVDMIYGYTDDKNIRFVYYFS